MWDDGEKLSCRKEPSKDLRRRFNHIPIPEIGFEAPQSLCNELMVTKCHSCITKLSTSLQSV